MIVVWIILGTVVVAIVVAAVIEKSSWNQICNYCNADGHPCPRCGGSGK